MRKSKSSHARSQAQPSTSTQESTGRPQVRCTACRVADHLRKDCCEDVFAQDAELGLTLWKCAVYPTKQYEQNHMYLLR